VALYHPKVGGCRHGELRRHRGNWCAAPQGEGLGNQFLANIRETDAIAARRALLRGRQYRPRRKPHRPAGRRRHHRHRALLKDLESIDKRIDRAKKALKGPASKDEKLTLEVCERVKKALDEGRPVRAQA